MEITIDSTKQQIKKELSLLTRDGSFISCPIGNVMLCVQCFYSNKKFEVTFMNNHSMPICPLRENLLKGFVM